jgi:hypothetical protein
MTNTTKRLNSYQLFVELLKDPERKSLIKITVELIHLFFVFKVIPRHYFSRFLFKKSRTNILDYFPNKFLHRIKRLFNEEEFVETLENKLFFDFFFRQFNIPLPEIIMYNHRKKFTVGQRSLEVNSSTEFLELLKALVKEKGINDSIFIKKTYWSYGGDRTYKVFVNEIEAGSEEINMIYNVIIKTGFLFQRTIKQHPLLDILNPSCVNTIRIDTFTDKDGQVEILSGHIRTSVNNLHVDNISSGGCGITLDLESGKLADHGFLELKNGGINWLTIHPITKTVFKDYSLPYIEEARQPVLEAARCMPALRIVGWDVAIGETGPILVEGNSNYDITGNELQYGGYRRNPGFRKLLKEMNYL